MLSGCAKFLAFYDSIISPSSIRNHLKDRFSSNYFSTSHFLTLIAGQIMRIDFRILFEYIEKSIIYVLEKHSKREGEGEKEKGYKEDCIGRRCKLLVTFSG